MDRETKERERRSLRVGNGWLVRAIGLAYRAIGRRDSHTYVLYHQHNGAQ